VDSLRMIVASGDFSGDRVAAVVIEPIQGEGGINVAPPGYLAAAREICDQYGAMLVFDEVQCGMGRSGKMFSCEMPIGAAVGTPKTWEKYIDNPFLHTTTFGGNPVCCAAAIATINVLLEEDLPKQAGEKGAYLLPRMNALAATYPNVMKGGRGRGLMLGMEFTSHEKGYAVAKALFGRGILISGTYINAQVLRVEPPLVVPYEILDRFLNALEDSLKEVDRTFAA
jgi:putrescine aminotransferase